ncbi:MAG: chalcone isomerase family protein [Minicystis sp.]
MQFARTRLPIFLAALVTMLLAVTGALADEWTLTGSGVRVKKVAIVNVDVYAISHYMKQLPPAKTKQAVIDMDTAKKFVWTMKRDVDKEKIQNALKDAFAMNGYGDAGKISQFTGAFSGDLKEKANVTIQYDPDKKATTVTVGGGGSATVPGVDFMKAVWSIWFGKNRPACPRRSAHRQAPVASRSASHALPPSRPRAPLIRSRSMRCRLLPLPLILAAAILAPARPAAADDGFSIKRNPVAPIAGTPLPNWSWPEVKEPKKAKSPGLVIAGAIVGGLGAAGAVAGLVIMGTSRVGCPNVRNADGSIATSMVHVDPNDASSPVVEVAQSFCPGPTTGRDVGLTTALAGAAVAAAGLTMILVGIQPAEDEAPSAARRLVPTVAISPTGGVLTWKF